MSDQPSDIGFQFHLPLTRLQNHRVNPERWTTR